MTDTGRDPYLDPDELDELEPVGDRATRPAAPKPRASRRTRRPGKDPRMARSLKFAAAGALVVGTIIGVWVASWSPSSALPPNHPTAVSAPTVTATPLDADAIARLEAKAKADPADTATRLSLAEQYATALRWPEAFTWQRAYADLRPDDTDARLVLGVYAYNNSDLPAAEKAWNEVLKRNPDSQEALYDLGFLYLAKTPPEEAKAAAMWQRAVEVDPESTTGKTAAHQLEALMPIVASPSASATPAP